RPPARPSTRSPTNWPRCRAPVLLVGDENEGCLKPALMLKRTIPAAGLVVLPCTGHTANLEEPGVFNRAPDSLLAASLAFRQVVWPRLSAGGYWPHYSGRVVRQPAGAKSSGRCCRRASNWSLIT